MFCSESVFSASAWLDVRVPLSLTLPPTIFALIAPAADSEPRVFSSMPPTVRLVSVALLNTPSVLSRSPEVAMFRLPALSLPPVLSNEPTFAPKLWLTFSVPPALLKLGPATAIVATLSEPPPLLTCGVLSVIGPPA